MSIFYIDPAPVQSDWLPFTALGRSCCSSGKNLDPDQEIFECYRSGNLLHKIKSWANVSMSVENLKRSCVK